MQNQPESTAHTFLETALQTGYDFQVARLEFMQRGWGGDCYRVETHSGACYFLKLHDSDSAGAFAASSRDFYLPLMDQLHHQGLLPHIPYPIYTRTGALERLKTLQTQARAAQPEMVVCHTDLHGDNIMRDAQGNLYLLDWENAMIAPREHDLIFFAGEGPPTWEIFWSVYARHFPAFKPDPHLLAFYTHRRGLEDIADFLVRIAKGDGGPQRDQEDLQELLEILDGLLSLE